jgi:D-glycero-alpha-D-manno-heptose-7-phosphate kinase
LRFSLFINPTQKYQILNYIMSDNIEQYYKSVVKIISSGPVFDWDLPFRINGISNSIGTGFFIDTQGFILKTKSESPVGGGLGGSSSLIISLMKGFGELTQRPIKNAHELVHIAHNIEAAILNTPTGTQDYYPAISGGLHILKYSEAGIHQDVLRVTHSPLSKYFLLVNTGHSHHSGLNNFEVMKSAVGKNPATLEALHELKQIALEMEVACREEKWQLLPALFNREFKARVYLSPAFTSPEIEKLQKLTLSHGAEAVKICGAGGGGCVLVWVEPSSREKVVQACQQQGFSVLGAKPIDLI